MFGTMWRNDRFGSGFNGLRCPTEQSFWNLKFIRNPQRQLGSNRIDPYPRTWPRFIVDGTLRDHDVMIYMALTLGNWLTCSIKWPLYLGSFKFSPSELQPHDTMAASNTTITLPNPYTPMAFVPPSLATNMTHEIYAAVGSLAVSFARFLWYRINCWLIQRQVLLWDILLHVAQDYSLAVKFGINLSFIIYLIARWVTVHRYPTYLIETSE